MVCFLCLTLLISGPVCIMVLEKQNAIADWRALIGPTDSVKAKATHPNRSYEFWSLSLYILLHTFETWFRTDVKLATCSFWVLIMVSSTISALGQCVGWTQRKIVFTVRILFYQLKEKSHFSLKKKLVISIPSLYIMHTSICLCTIYFRFLLVQYFLLSPL